MVGQDENIKSAQASYLGVGNQWVGRGHSCITLKSLYLSEATSQEGMSFMPQGESWMDVKERDSIKGQFSISQSTRLCLGNCRTNDKRLGLIVPSI